jgi:hypothetical protein
MGGVHKAFRAANANWKAKVRAHGGKVKVNYAGPTTSGHWVTMNGRHVFIPNVRYSGGSQGFDKIGEKVDDYKRSRGLH